MLRIIAYLGLLFGANALVAQDENSGDAISYSDVQTRGVVGKLGLKLGTVTKVSGSIISGAELRTKAADGRYFLKISHVDEKQLKSPVVLGFRIPPWVNVNLASNHFDLYQIKHRRRANSLNSSQVEQLETNYVGRTVELMVFEEGEFTGLPNGLDPMEQWSAPVFHFSTHLSVLKDLDSNSILPPRQKGLHWPLVVAGIVALMLGIGCFVTLKRKSKIAT